MQDNADNWQRILAQGFATATDLLHFLNLSPTLASCEAEKQFKTRVPRGFALRMKSGDPNDPLLKQVLARPMENIIHQQYSKDPLDEKASNPYPGLLHKYYGRVLLTLTGACAVHCRYCFRRHFPYDENNPREAWDDILTYIRQDPSIHEVILSGGDPLLLNDMKLFALIEAVSEIPTVTMIRFHTRVPIVLPARITKDFIDKLSQIRLKKVMVLHCNHPQELDETVKVACDKLKAADCLLLNQTVLLAEVNDEVQILQVLSQKLFDFGVLPYYLHLLDKVQGAAHFDLSKEKAKSLHLAMQAMLPGYLVPKLVSEVPGAKHKVLS